jgi:hypothetical protein
MKINLITAVVFAALSLVLVAGCGDEIYDDPIPTEITDTVQTHQNGPSIELEIGLTKCLSNDGCEAVEVCLPFEEASEYQLIKVCTEGCDAKLDTVVTEKDDGTTITEIVRSNDTCQRFGDPLYCDMDKDSDTYRQCLVMVSDPDVTEPTEPTEPVEEDDSVEITCCYAGNLDGLYGQFGWSESTLEDPEAWGAGRDLSFTGECYSYVVDDSTMVYDGVYFSDVTDDVHTGLQEHDSAINWIGWDMEAPTCYVGETEAVVGDFTQNRGWPFWLE